MKKLIISLIVGILYFFSADAYALCVNASDANLRSGPGTKYEKTWEVFKYMPFNKIKKKGNWYNVKDMDGDVHWIYKNLVTDSFKCGAAIKDKINIRSGPGIQYKKVELSPAMKYDAFKIVTTKDKWVKVEDEFGSTGWIFRKLLWIQ